MKKLLFLSLTGLLITSFLVTPVSAASDTKASSDVSVSFKKGSGPTNPVDPQNPNEPDPDPEDPGTEMGGALSIDYVPGLNFGTNIINGSMAVYTAVNQTPYLQVSDKRGTGSGWKVTVCVSEFKNIALTKSFDGVITFKNPSVVTTTGNESIAPKTVESVSVKSRETEQRIFGTLNQNEGMGTWLARWYAGSENPNSTITLSVNTGNVFANESYRAQLTWALYDAP